MQPHDVLPDLKGAVAGLTLDYGTDIFFEDIDDEILAAVQATRAVLHGLGADLIEMAVPEFRAVMEMDLRYAINATES